MVFLSSTNQTVTPLEKLATDEDINLLFLLCLGRGANARAIAEKRGGSLGSILERLLISREFTESVLRSLSTDAPRLRVLPADQHQKLARFAVEKLGVIGDATMLTEAALLGETIRNARTFFKKSSRSARLEPTKLFALLSSVPRRRPPESELNGESLGATASRGDIIQLFRLCLGRSPSEATVTDKMNQSRSMVLSQILGSKEFAQQVLPFLGTNESRLRHSSKVERMELAQFLRTYLSSDEDLTRLTKSALLLMLLKGPARPTLTTLTQRGHWGQELLFTKLGQAPRLLNLSDEMESEDVRVLMMLFLGRYPFNTDDLNERSRPGRKALVDKLLFSLECQERLLEPAIVGHPLPHSTEERSPSPSLISRVGRIFSLAERTLQSPIKESSWETLLASVLSAESFRKEFLGLDPNSENYFSQHLVLRAAQVLRGATDDFGVLGVTLEEGRSLCIALREDGRRPNFRLRASRGDDPSCTVDCDLLAPTRTPSGNAIRVPLPENFIRTPPRSVLLQFFEGENPEPAVTLPYFLGPRDKEIADWIRKANRCVRRGEYCSAEEFYRRAVAANPLLRERLAYARILGMRGAVEEALVAIGDSCPKDSVDFTFYRSGLLVRLGKYSAAIEGYCNVPAHSGRSQLSRLLCSCVNQLRETSFSGLPNGPESALCHLLTPFFASPEKRLHFTLKEAEVVEEEHRNLAAWLCIQACLVCHVSAENISKLVVEFCKSGWTTLTTVIHTAEKEKELSYLLPVLALFDPKEIESGILLLRLARYHENIGELEKAVPFALRAAELPRPPEDAPKIASFICQKMGRLKDAARFLHIVVATTPEDVRSWQRLAGVERQILLREPERSREHLAKAVEHLIHFAAAELSRDPRNEGARFQLAQSLCLGERFTEAYAILVQLHSSTTLLALKERCVRELGQICDKLALSAEAEKWNRLRLETENSPKAIVLLAKALRSQNRAEDAQILLDGSNDNDDELVRERTRNLFFLGDFQAASERAEASLERCPTDVHLRLYAAAAHLELGNLAAASAHADLLDARNESTAFGNDVHLLRFDILNRVGDETSAFTSLNRVFANIECQEILPVGERRVPLFDRLTGRGIYPSGSKLCRPPTHEDPVVSVIMTSFNAQEHIETAVRSLLEQSYSKLEIIIVDDASDDDTPRILARLEEEDPRVHPILRTVNSGTYVSKNVGLLHATGEFVAFQDSDDWSHPDRLKKGIAFLQERPKMMAITTDWIRMTTEGALVIKAGVQICHVCCISLVFRRKPVMKRLGFFDSVRIEADMEFIRRIRLVFGHASVARLHWPLLFGRSHAESLTASAEYGITRTGFTEPRLDYQAAQREWHKKITEGASAHIRFPLVKRPFDAPNLMLPVRGGRDSV